MSDLKFDISSLIEGALRMSAAAHQDLYESWVRASYKVGTLLPATELLVSVQRVGEMDMLLRSMEDAQTRRSEPEAAEFLFSFNFQLIQSELWIASAYEIVRLLNARKVMDGDEFVRTYHELTVLRVSLAKHELANERLIDEPIEFRRTPMRPNDKSEFYNRKDPQRAFSRGRGLSDTGSAMWEVFDVKHDQHYWLDRREMSDRILRIFRNAERAVPSS